MSYKVSLRMDSARLLCLLAAMMPGLLLAVPVVSNVSFVQQATGTGSTRVRVTYDLESSAGNAKAVLLYSTDNGATYLPATNVSGGASVAPGTGRTLDWAVAGDLAGLEINNLMVRVVADDNVPISVTITGSVPSGIHTTTPSQNVTILLNELVTSFDANSVVVTNASKDSFSVISPLEYTMALTATGEGAVNVTVPAGSLTAASGSGNVNALGAFVYTYDLSPPYLTARIPGPGGVTNAITSVRVQFNEPVIGVVADQLSVNGSAATTVIGSNPYIFSGFTPPDSAITITVAPGSVVDTLGFPFAGDTWTTDFDNTPPTLVSQVPAPGSFLTSLTSIVLTTSEVVGNLRAEHLKVNGSPATSVSGSNPYTLSGFAVPETGAVTVELTGGVAFDAARNLLAASSWTYDFDAPPHIVTRMPASGATIGAIPNVVLTLNETVIGLTAGQLTVNGSAATTVTGSNPYTFSGFANPPLGTVTIDLASGATVDSVGSALVPATWSCSYQEILQTVPAPGGAFVMGRTEAGDDLAANQADELPRRGVALSPYDIGRTEITNAQFAEVMNWALVRGYLAGDLGGSPYAGETTVRLMAADASSTRQPLFTIFPGSATSQIEWSGSAFVPRTRDSQSMADHPVINASWFGAVAFANFMSEREGKPLAYNLSTWQHIDAEATAGLQYAKGYRLPTEAEWERAAAWDGATHWIHSMISNTLTGTMQANYSINNPAGLATAPQTSPVGWYNGSNAGTTDSPSPVGAYDMAGNAPEWVHDWYSATGYSTGATTNPVGPGSGASRVIRGGSWTKAATFCRSAARNGTSTPDKFSAGFRVALTRDRVPLTITADSVSPLGFVGAGTRTMTFTFGEAVTDFTTDDITVTGATKGAFATVSPSVYQLQVTAPSTGTVLVSVPAGAALDAGAAATYGAQFTFTVDTVLPVVVGRVPASGSTVTAIPSVQVTLNKPVIGLVGSQLTVNGAPATNVTGTNPYTFTGFTAPFAGTIPIVLSSGSATDVAGNPLIATSWNCLLERSINLTITGAVPNDSSSEVGNQTITFQFEADVSGFTASDVTVRGATASNFQTINPSRYTMLIAPYGGTASVAVPAGAAVPSSPYTGVAGSAFSYHYRDTWTLQLQASPLVQMELLRVRAGTFNMGSPLTEAGRLPDEVLHQVTLTKDYYLAKTPVTQAQWLALSGFPRPQITVGATLPTHNLTWNDVDTWVTMLNDWVTAPGTLRLPTEAQWEYACRAGTTTRFSFGDALGAPGADLCVPLPALTNFMWYCGNALTSIQPVGLKPANPWGFRDMHGNVHEWCLDWSGSYGTSPVVDPTGPTDGATRIIRGGSWDSFAYTARSAHRAAFHPDTDGSSFGIRVAGTRPAPLTITGPMPHAGTTSLNPNTFTFTFAEEVTGFTADDIAIGFGSKQTFTQISPRVYTLVISSPVFSSPVRNTITVEEGAANDTSSNWTSTAGATFRWTQVP